MVDLKLPSTLVNLVLLSTSINPELPLTLVDPTLPLPLVDLELLTTSAVRSRDVGVMEESLSRDLE